ncbi:MAG: hypothetical protein KC502_07365 [Myxococcales bacterium]|nr:hypothetical protein [Myxococcales bacterium]
MQLYYTLNAVLGLLTLALCIHRAVRGGAAERIGLVVIGAGVALGAAVFQFLPAQEVWELGTTLTEGGSLVAASTVMGDLRDPLLNAGAFRALAGHGFVPPLEGIHRMNLALAAFNVFAFATLSAHVLGSWTSAVAAAFALAVTPLFDIAAVAETPSQLLFTYGMVGTLCYQTVFSSKTRTDWPGWAGMAGLALLVMFSANTRQEPAIVALPAAALAFWRLLLGPTQFSRRADRLWRLIQDKIGDWRQNRMLLAGGALLIVSPAVVVELLGEYARFHELRAVLHAINPLDTSTLALLINLWDTVSPGVIALIVLGIVSGHRRPIHTGFVAISGLALYRAYHTAGHDGRAPYELVRYLSFLLPVLALWAVFGWRVVQQTWTSRPLRRTFAAVVMTGLFTNPATLTSQRLDRTRTFVEIADRSTQAGWLSMEMQRQVRFLAAAVAKRPKCRIIIPTARQVQRPDSEIHGLVTGGLIVIDGTSAEQYEATTVAALQAQIPSLNQGCVLYHVSLDCHQVGYQGCEKSWMKGPIVARSKFPYEGYSEPGEHGVYDGRIDLRLYDVSPK